MAGAVPAIVENVQQADLTAFEAWSDLDALSGNTQVDGIEVDPAGISITGDKFTGIANVYVVLEYGGGPGRVNGFSTSDAFRGKFSGHLNEDGEPVLEKFAVDTSPFFAGENVG